MANKKVRMVVKISGARDGEDWPDAGEFITVPSAEAEDLIRQGFAADPSARAEENALADVLGVETATTKEGQKAVRTQIKPAPHADEPDAYHVPELPGEKAAAKAGQKEVDAANKDLIGTEATETNAKRAGK